MEEVEHLNGLEARAGAVEEQGEVIDPMSPEIAPGLSLIVLMRIYEVQLAQLREMNPEVAEKLLHMHAEGRISTPLPYIDPETMG